MTPSPRSTASGVLAAPLALIESWPLAAVFIVLLAAAAAPILATPVAPLADFVNHLARMRVLADIGDTPGLAEIFRVEWAVIPNLTMDGLVPPLARLIGVYPAGQLFLALTVALLASGPMVLHRVVMGVWSPWPLMVFPFIYNGVFLFGLVNYLFGVGLAVWGAAAWAALLRRPLWTRAVLSALLVPCLFFCHLFAVGLYGLAIFALETARLAESRRFNIGETVRAALAVGAPFLPALYLLTLGPTMGLAGENQWESVGKFDGLVMAIQAYSDLPDMAVIALSLGGTVWLARRGALSMAPAGLILALSLLAVYLAMPRMLFGSWMADQRLPAAALFLLAGFVRFAPRGAVQRNLLLAVILAASITRFADVEVHWRALDAEVQEFRDSAALIGPGARVLVAYADEAAAARNIDAAISHAPCVATIERGAAVSTLFTVPGKQILNLQSDYRGLVDADDGEPPTVSRLLATVDGPQPAGARYWDQWPQRYDYLYVLYAEPGDPNPDPDHLSPLAHGRRFQLYAVRPEPLQEDLDL